MGGRGGRRKVQLHTHRQVGVGRGIYKAGGGGMGTTHNAHTAWYAEPNPPHAGMRQGIAGKERTTGMAGSVCSRQQAGGGGGTAGNKCCMVAGI